MSYRTMKDLNSMTGVPELFNRGMGPRIQGFKSGLFSTVCIDRLCQWESMMVTLSPGLIKTPMHYGEITADMNL